MRVANIRALNVAETCSQSVSIKIASIAFRFIVGSNTLYRLRNIYIYIVCNYSQPVAAAVATDIYTYTYIFYIHIYQYQSGLCCTTSPACTLLGYVHGSSAVFCLASVGHAGVADRLHLEVVKQPAKYIVCCRCVPSGDSGQALRQPR